MIVAWIALSIAVVALILAILAVVAVSLQWGKTPEGMAHLEKKHLQRTEKRNAAEK